MSKINSYEFYQTCPSCGAVNNGSSACAYCGASLVKSQTVREMDGDSQEDAYAYEDMYLPVEKGKLGEVNEFLLLFCPIFGGCFLLVPIIVGACFISTGIMESWVWMMFSLFALIGIVSFIPLISSVYGKIKCKNGQQLYGTVRGYEHTNVMINGSPTLAMRVRVDSYPGPRLLIINTGLTRRMAPVGMTIRLRNYKKYYRIDR